MVQGFGVRGVQPQSFIIYFSEFVKGLNLSYHNQETILFIIDPESPERSRALRAALSPPRWWKPWKAGGLGLTGYFFWGIIRFRV